MQSEWAATHTVSELIAAHGGSIKTGPFGTTLKASEYAEVGVPLISVREIGHGSFHVDEKTPRVAAATLLRLPEYILEEGDIVFARKGGIERCALIRKQQSGWFLGSDGIRLRPPKVCDARFLSYALQTPAIKEWLIQHSTGSTMASLNQSTIGRLPVMLPSPSAQRAVADTLDAFDSRIDLLRQTNATLESVAQTLFKSWFVDFEPVRAKVEGREPEAMDAARASLFPAEFQESALGPIPKGWRAGDLAQLCEESGGFVQTGPFGSQLHASDYEEEGVPVVMPQDLEARRISTDRVARVSDVHVQRLERHKLAAGDIVFSRRGDVGRHAAVSDAEAGWLCGTGCLLVRPGLNWPSPAFLSQALATSESTDWLKRHAVGATMPNLNTGILGALPILLPDLPVLAAFESVVGPLEARIDANRAQATRLRDLRDALLPRLISGKLRLPEAQAPLEDAVV